jgi:hypothetical protein
MTDELAHRKKSYTVIARRNAPWQSLGDSRSYEIAALRSQ